MRKRNDDVSDLPDFAEWVAGMVCSDDFEEYVPFREWALANGYAEGLTIDRIDNNKGYSPENCRWVTMLVQMRNTRRNRFIEYNGERKTVSAWATDAGMKYGTLWGRLKRGLTLEEALRHKNEKRKEEWQTS